MTDNQTDKPNAGAVTECAQSPLRRAVRAISRRFGKEQELDVEPNDEMLIEELMSGPQEPPSPEFTDRVMQSIRQRDRRKRSWFQRLFNCG